jgi:hypothetical protein
MQVQTFFDPATFTLSYVVYDEGTKDAVIIDPVLDYDPAGAETRPLPRSWSPSFDRIGSECTTS